MKQQLKLTLEELVTLASERLVEQGKLKNNTVADITLHFDTYALEEGYVVISQEADD